MAVAATAAAVPARQGATQTGFLANKRLVPIVQMLILIFNDLNESKRKRLTNENVPFVRMHACDQAKGMNQKLPEGLQMLFQKEHRANREKK